MTLKPCLVHRCPNYADSGDAYCAEHRRDRVERGVTGTRTNTWAWRQTRAQALRRARGRCQLRLTAACGLVATHVHHRDLDSSNDEPSNLAACCESCHEAAHELARLAAARRIGAR